MVGGIVLLVAIVLGAAAIGYLAYNAGVVEGVAAHKGDDEGYRLRDCGYWRERVLCSEQ